MAPILDELEMEYEGTLAVEFLNVGQNENVKLAQALNVELIPTQIYFDAEGEELWRHVGFISKADLLDKWQELGYKMQPVEK
jgi:thioredoxin 1